MTSTRHRAYLVLTCDPLTQHRLGQTHPVIAIKYIIENSIEQRLLEAQKKKADLANMTLGRPLSKQELQQRRLEELNKLLG